MVMGGRASSKEGRGRVVAYVVDCSRPTPSYPLLALAARKGEARNGPTPTHQMRQVASSQPAVVAHWGTGRKRRPKRPSPSFLGVLYFGIVFPWRWAAQEASTIYFYYFFSTSSCHVWRRERQTFCLFWWLFAKVPKPAFSLYSDILY